MPSRSLAIPFAALLLALSACAPARDATADTPSGVDAEPPAVAGPPASRPPVNLVGAGSCDAKAAQSLVGRTADAAVAEQARAAAGARAVRVLRPGQMVTMEYRADRLNIDVDAQGVITGIRCG